MKPSYLHLSLGRAATWLAGLPCVLIRVLRMRSWVPARCIGQPGSRTSWTTHVVAILLLLCVAPFAPFASAQTADEKAIAKKLFQGAWDLKAKGNPIASIMLFEGGLKLDPQNALAHFHLAVIYEATGDAASARKHFAEVVRIAPQSEAASKARARLSGNAPTPQMASSKDRIVYRLEWAESDNGADIRWLEAKNYCENKGNGWRLPSTGELQSSYNSGQLLACGKHMCKTASKSRLTGRWFWSFESNSSSDAWFVDLADGDKDTVHVKNLFGNRALCVRRH